MALSNKVKAIPLSTLDSATLTGGYDLLVDGLAQACFTLRIINDSDTDVIISYDGVNDNDFLTSNDLLQLEVQHNAEISNGVAKFPKGIKVYAKGAAGIGNIYLAGYYQY